jgi:hypothetical protein
MYKQKSQGLVSVVGCLKLAVDLSTFKWLSWAKSLTFNILSICYSYFAQFPVSSSEYDLTWYPGNAARHGPTHQLTATAASQVLWLKTEAVTTFAAYTTNGSEFKITH